MENKKSIAITKIAIAQSFGTHQLKIGEGFEHIIKSNEPFIIIDNHPVYVRGYNLFEDEFENYLIHNFDIKRVYKFGEYYNESLKEIHTIAG